jgi:hypothetical protein
MYWRTGLKVAASTSRDTSFLVQTEAYFSHTGKNNGTERGRLRKGGTKQNKSRRRRRERGTSTEKILEERRGGSKNGFVAFELLLIIGADEHITQIVVRIIQKTSKSKR